jgi:hypothetical protein
MAETAEIGKYSIVEQLGSGGFATVFRAVDSTLGREVALKVLHPPLLVDKSFVERFFREARTLARLRHPNIVTVHEVSAADGRVFIAMDLAASNLAHAISGGQTRPWAQVSAIIEPVAAALDYAHGRGVVHCDLKPANILLSEEGRPLLSDFGFARALGDVSASFSVGSGILGTPSYIAPEVWDGQPAGRPADIYALACIAYELANGRVLFRGDTPLRAVAAHAAGPQLPAGWPPAVSAFFRKALARDPAERYASAEEFARALRAATEDVAAPAAPTPQPVATEQHQPPRPATVRLVRATEREPAIDAAGEAPVAASQSRPEAAPSKQAMVAAPAPSSRPKAAAPRPPEQREQAAPAAARLAAQDAPARQATVWRALLAAALATVGWGVFGFFILEFIHPYFGLERLLINEAATLLTAAALAVSGTRITLPQLLAFAVAGLAPSIFLQFSNAGYFPPEWVMRYMPAFGLLVAFSAARSARARPWLVGVAVTLIFLLIAAIESPTYTLVRAFAYDQLGNSDTMAIMWGSAAALALHAAIAMLLTVLLTAWERRAPLPANAPG